MQHHLALAALEVRDNTVGALIDDREAQVLEHGDALREPHRRIEPVDGGAQARLGRVHLAVEINGHRPIGAQPLDAADILQRARRRKRLLIAGGESPAVLDNHSLRVVTVDGQQLRELIRPGAHDAGNSALECGYIDARSQPFPAADDELHAHQRPIREIREECSDVTFVGFG